MHKHTQERHARSCINAGNTQKPCQANPYGTWGHRASPPGPHQLSPTSMHPHRTRHPPASGSWCHPHIPCVGLSYIHMWLPVMVSTLETGAARNTMDVHTEPGGCLMDQGRMKRLSVFFLQGGTAPVSPSPVSPSPVPAMLDALSPVGQSTDPTQSFLSRQHFSRQLVFHYLEELLCLISSANIAT